MSFVFSKSCVHAKDVLSSLFELKTQKSFCDVILVAGKLEVSHETGIIFKNLIASFPLSTSVLQMN